MMNGTKTEKKVVPQNLSWVNDFSVAKWYMDDGSLYHSKKQKDRACFSTNSFSKGDTVRLANKLTELYSVNCTVFYNKGWSIRINYCKGTINTFWTSISKHIIPCMKYKLPIKYRTDEYTDVIGTSKIQYEPVKSKILNVENLQFNKIGYDIETTTNNYFVKGILVHNSMLLVFKYGGEIITATRGSFESDQALDAKRFITFSFGVNIPEGLTYVFEYIAHVNKIVCRYDYEGLVLLTALDTKGVEVSRSVLDKQAKLYLYKRPKIYSFESLEHILKYEEPNTEGFVLRYEDNSRIKCKNDEYTRLHKLLTGFNEKDVWENLKNGTLDKVLEEIPDEMFSMVKKVQEELENKFKEIEQSAIDYFVDLKDRKENALHYQKYKYPFILFNMLDGKDYKHQIWKTICPKITHTYKRVEEDSN